MERWALVGRSEERSFLEGIIADPARAGVLVAGKAGVGKTRLLREVAGAAGDCHREYVTATESARPLPFGAFAHLLPDSLRKIEQVDLLAVIGRHLAERAGGRPLILNVDDVHLLDQFSAALVHHVATSRSATVLLTMRSGHTAPDAIAALYRDGVIARLELQPISRPEFDRLLETELGGPIETHTLNRLWETTQGNVFFTHELVTDALESGTLTRDHGLWRWSTRIGFAPRVQEAVAARLGVLAPPERRLVEFLAVGEPIPLASVQRLSPEASVPDLERRSVLEIELESGAHHVRLAHPLFSEAIRAEIPVSLLRQINHELADELSEDPLQGPEAALKLAVLREAAGTVVDPHVLLDAAARANLLSDYQLGERLAAAAMAQDASADALLELGRAYLGQHRYQDTEAVLLPLIGHEPDDAFRAQLLETLTQAMHMDAARERVDEMVATCEVIERGVSDPHIKAFMQCHRAAILALSGHFAEAIEIGLRGLESVEDDAVAVRVVAPLVTSLTMAGRIDEALSIADGAFERALRIQDRLPRAPAMVVFPRITALFFAGRIEEALELIDLGLQSAQHLSASLIADAHAFQGRFHLALGRPRTAARLLQEANVTMRHHADTVEPGWCLAVEAEAHALLGHQQATTVATTTMHALRQSGYAIFQTDRGRAMAWVAAQSGHLSGAIDQLWAVADVAAGRGQRCVELFILEDLLRLGELRAADRCLEVTALVDGDWSAAVRRHALAAQSSTGADYMAAAEAFGAMGCALIAAELWQTASTAYQQEGLQRRAAEAARHSSDLLAQCEGARTPALSVSPATNTVLTRREREAAELAAQGNSNTDIADLLSLSVRTVESHLYSAFAKLGITERSQLAQAMQSQAR